MHYNSCRLNGAQKAVLKYTPKNNHILNATLCSLLKNQENTIVYLTLKNDEAFWFLIKECNEKQLIGFAKLDQTWVHKLIEVSNIRTFC
ncbi:hypothetical protein CLNEO_11780 [Anaerotignum neopropionicum]|uniref:Uncharacterized protein n=1 Tax=Anaerotignum neopropionicum TaxID=36847 RepID=A0A136WFH8_9FIRM|nr:hypothetical protein [Anaerotignum neopropionicum]KXL53207.1 hypothetical protein CLNEO_11780 [Anaerotignum neopropionicum]